MGSGESERSLSSLSPPLPLPSPAPAPAPSAPPCGWLSASSGGKCVGGAWSSDPGVLSLKLLPLRIDRGVWLGDKGLWWAPCFDSSTPIAPLPAPLWPLRRCVDDASPCACPSAPVNAVPTARPAVADAVSLAGAPTLAPRSAMSDAAPGVVAQAHYVGVNAWSPAVWLALSCGQRAARHHTRSQGPGDSHPHRRLLGATQTTSVLHPHAQHDSPSKRATHWQKARRIARWPPRLVGIQVVHHAVQADRRGEKSLHQSSHGTPSPNQTRPIRFLLTVSTVAGCTVASSAESAQGRVST